MGTTTALDLLELLVTVSEKAADIARAIRGEKDLFEDLVEKKENDFKKFDYKTLADVLIQATATYLISRKFPSMKGNIKGEESSQFVSTAGVKVSLELGDSPSDTAKTLEAVLQGRPRLIEHLIKIIYSDRVRTIEGNVREEMKGACVDTSRTGVWIDPIDGTNEYIHGVTTLPVGGIHSNGIQVSLVLIGAYDTVTGIPIMGVINQPFHLKNDDQWSGRVIWGVAKEDCKVTSIPLAVPTHTAKQDSKLCLLSSVDKLVVDGWETRYVSGCGYKLLCVIDGLADAFVLTPPSCYKWDTCGPQAILTALGGGIVSWAEFITNNREVPLVYNEETDNNRSYNNTGGVMGYRDISTVRSLTVNSVNVLQ